ncbi:hypothetical protein ABH945_005957 [Paraburkholderia sp. GAS333]|uniref:hypothetical protein n=1 Tax=Paraburkholderia sp. GAS333 TaxID=3156279 RepID=UPI003D1EAE2B
MDSGKSDRQVRFCPSVKGSTDSCGTVRSASSVLGSLLAPTTDMSAEDRQARENLVTSLVAGIAMASGTNAATATGAGLIEVENNQASIPEWLKQTYGSPVEDITRWVKEFAGKVVGNNGQTPPADPNPLVDADNGGHPPAAGGSAIMVPVCEGPACMVMPVATPGYAPGTATLNSGNDANSESVGDSSGSSGKSRNKPPAPLPEADGLPHTIIERPGPDGQYTTYNSDGTSLQYRGSGQDHGGIPRPNVKETSTNVAPDGTVFVGKGVVRPATPNEIPRGK